MPLNKSSLIEPLNVSFEQGMRVIINAPTEAEKPIMVVDKTLSHLTGKVHCSDCIQFMNEKIPAESISVIVTSPPYNLKNSTGNGMKDGRGGKWPNAALQNGYESHNDNMPHNEYAMHC